MMRFGWMGIASAFLAITASAQITTSQYDNARTGANPHETVLTPQNVNAKQFGKLGAFKVDGPVYAQPLYLPGVEIPNKGKHNVLYVATEHDSVYAFDADQPNSEPLWKVSLLASGTEPLTPRDVQCPFLRPEVGITSTPVIDMQRGTLYVLARSVLRHTLSANQYMQHVHALAITTGAEKFGGPKVIAANSTGKGAGNTNGQIAFDALRENPRAALLLVNGNLIITWASSCDVDPYHGWVMSYDANTLAQKAALNVTPDGSEGGIWASDTGPAADAQGNVFVPTGNGTFNAASGGHDFGDSVLKLDAATLALRDYFTPHDEAELSSTDADLGSSGPTLIPDQKGQHAHLLLQPTKGGMIYVIDRDAMGKFQRDRDAIVQAINLGEHGAYGAMAYWNGHAYFAASGDYLRDYAVSSTGLREIARAVGPRFENPGATPAVSADGTTNAIIWAIATRTWNGAERPAVLYAYEAAKLTKPIYSSEENSGRDRAAAATRFVVPVVVDGHVYFGTRSEVEVYGLLK
jgi:hypothetical protein